MRTDRQRMLRLERRSLDVAGELLTRLRVAQGNIRTAIERIAEKQAATTSARTRNVVYGYIGEQYETFGAEVDRWVGELVEDTAVKFHGYAVDDLKHGRKRPFATFSRERVRQYWELIHPDNEQSLAAVFTQKMTDTAKRQLRSAFVDTFRQQAVEGWTARETQKNLQERWDTVAGNQEGDRFIDASGRRWTNATYLQMLTRTNAQTVSRESYVDTLVKSGFTLARISDDGDPCPVCQAWAGVIIRVAGDGGDYPTLEEARAAGWGHPNCTCRLDYMDETVDADAIEQQADTETPDLERKKTESDAEYRNRITPEIAEYSKDFGG
jgi:hypothetical protein